MVVEFHDPYVGTVRIAEKHVPDLYQMACDYTRQRGNTFHFLKRQIEEQYPDLKGKCNE
jgi:hypothetical protein